MPLHEVRHEFQFDYQIYPDSHSSKENLIDRILVKVRAELERHALRFRGMSLRRDISNPAGEEIGVVTLTKVPSFCKSTNDFGGRVGWRE